MIYPDNKRDADIDKQLEAMDCASMPVIEEDIENVTLCHIDYRKNYVIVYVGQ